MPEFQDLWLQLRDFLALAVTLALPAILLWLFVRRHGGIWPPQRHRLVAWTALEVVAVFVFVFFLLPAFFIVPLIKIQSVLHEGVDPLKDPNLAIRSSLWGTLIALPFQLATLFGLLRFGSGTRPYQLGVTTNREGQNLLLGYLFWLIFTPTVLTFNFAVRLGHQTLFDQVPTPHPLEKLAHDSPLASDWVLIVVTALLLAPITEELVFRGILQGWATGSPQRSDRVMAAVVLKAFLDCVEDVAKAIGSHGFGSDMLQAAQPFLFALLLLPAYGILRWRSSSAAPVAICSSGICFALFHSGVWPSPIPLVILGIALGYLAYRTQSLLGPIVMHSLFNAVAVLGLLHPSR